MYIHKLLFLFVALAFFSCSDDEPGTDPEPSIVGTWNLDALNSMDGIFTQTGGQLDLNGTFVMTGINLNATVDIKDDNTYTSIGTLEVETKVTIGPAELDGPTSTSFLGSGTWSKSGNTLVLVSDGETNNSTIITLTETDFVLDFPLESTEDNMDVITALSGTLRYEFSR